MSAKRLGAAASALLLATLALGAWSQEPATTAPTADLEIILEHTNGKTDTYAEQIVRMELILDAAGRLDQVHLITRSGREADTHIWYNVSNLVSVRYRFLEITGKGKVAVRTVLPPALKETSDTPGTQVVPLDPEDYR